MNICNFSLTMSGQVFLKVLGGGEELQGPRGLCRKFQSGTSNPVAQKPNVNIYKTLSILYPASFSFYAFSSPFFPLFSLILFFTLFHLLSFFSCPQSVHSERGFSDGKERASNKAVLQDRALWREVAGDLGQAQGLVLRALRLSTERKH